jgi:NTE family protein
MAKKQVGLALSGGAARGFAHIGVIKVLQQHGIPVDCVAGTSVGSIVGALFCAGYRWERMLEIAEELKWRELVRPTLSGLGLVKADRLERFIGRLLGEMTFEELETPFSAVVVDIARAEEIVFSTGSVARAVRASASVPGIFEPLIDGDTALVDGGVKNNLPSLVVRSMGADRVIAVDLNAQRPHVEVPVNLLDVSYRSFATLLDTTSAAGRKDADILIQPDLRDFSYHDLSQADSLVERGEAAALGFLKKLNRLR